MLLPVQQHVARHGGGGVPAHQRTGRGRHVAQAPLAQELKKLFADEVFSRRRSDDMHDEAKRFFVNYFKQISNIFESAWHGRKYSIKSATALRAFIRVAPDVLRKVDKQHGDRTDFRAIGRVISPWGRRIGALRFRADAAGPFLAASSGKLPPARSLMMPPIATTIPNSGSPPAVRRATPKLPC